MVNCYTCCLIVASLYSKLANVLVALMKIVIHGVSLVLDVLRWWFSKLLVGRFQSEVKRLHPETVFIRTVIPIPLILKSWFLEALGRLTRHNCKSLFLIFFFCCFGGDVMFSAYYLSLPSRKRNQCNDMRGEDFLGCGKGREEVLWGCCCCYCYYYCFFSF